MSTLIWLDAPTLKEIQSELLARFGGLDGLREEGLLDSALHRPLQLHAYGDPDLHELAAAYTYGIVRNHPFLDGNKRAGFMAAYTFLGINGVHLHAIEEEAVIMTVDLAAGKMSQEIYAHWLRENSSPMEA